MISRAVERTSRKRILDLLIFLVGVSGLIWYLAQFRGEFTRLSGLGAGNLAVLSALILLGHGLVAIKLWLSVRLFGSQLSPSEAFLLVESGSLINLVPLNLGTPFRAVYLKRAARLKYADYGLSFLLTQATSFLAAGALGLILLAFFADGSSALHGLFVGYGLVPLGILLAGYLFSSLSVGRLSGRLATLQSSLSTGFGIVLKRPAIVSVWFLIDLGTNLTLGIRFWVIGQLLGYDTDLAAAVIMQAVARLSAIFTIIPAGTIGVREALSGFGASGLSKLAVEGVMIATLDRVVVTFWVVTLGTVGLRILRRRYEASGGSSG